MDPLLLVVDGLGTGGAERHVVDLAAALAERGRAVHVACSASGPLERELAASGVPVHVLGSVLVKRRTCLGYAGALRRLVSLLQPAVVHAHLHASEVAAALALQHAPVPLVLTEHTEGPWRTRTDAGWARRACARASAVVAVSSAVCRCLHEQLAVPYERIELVVPAVLPSRAPALPRTRDRPASGPRVGYVGRLIPEKGVDLLVGALPAVRERVPGVRLQVVGDGCDRARLEQLAAPVGGVEFLGFRADVPALLRQVDVLAVPSRSDGSPLVVAEANAAGVAVVAFAVGGLPDRIRHGIDGVLVPSGDRRGLAEALVRLLRDDALRDRLAAAGTVRAAGETHGAMVERHEALYARLADRTASAATAAQNL